jgi:hypothetical protein
VGSGRRACLDGCIAVHDAYHRFARRFAKRWKDKPIDGDDSDEKNPGRSIRTSNFYLKAAQQSCRWMIRNKRALDLALIGLEPQDPETDRRLRRRVLTVKELGTLIETAQMGRPPAGPVFICVRFSI